MQPSFVRKLGLWIYKTNVNDQKINNSRLKTYQIVIVSFQMNEKEWKFLIFQKTFLLLDINIDIAFRIVFFILNNIKVNFSEQELK